MDLRRAESIFVELLAMPEADRGARLAERCGNDDELRALVERLLRHDDDGMGGFLAPLGPTLANAEPADVPAPDRISHYNIIRMIGQGGMGAVYEATDEKLDRRVALKTLPQEMASNPSWLRRFNREARAVAALNHPNIVTLFSVENDGGVHFLTMELVAGGTLAERIPSGGLPLETFLDTAIALADALMYAHDQGVAHRDLKPTNIVLADDGRPKILDFGLAKFIHGPRQPASPTSPADTITAAGLVFGTPSYIAPEQLKGKNVDHRVDIYSLGAVLFEMVTGHAPFTGDSIAETTSSVLRDRVPSVRADRADMPPELDHIIRKCLSKDASDRYPTARALRDELGELRVGMQSGSVRLRTRRALLPYLAIVAGVIVAGVALFANLRPTTPPSHVNPTTHAPAQTERPRLVVLPFDNLGEAEDEYLVAGIAQEITSRLVEIGGLSVVSRTSSSRLARQGKSILEIGRELNVAYVLDGTVYVERAADGSNTLRVTPELIDVGLDRNIWTQRYSATPAPGEMFDVQSSIAMRVADELHITLASNERNIIRAIPTEDAIAYDNFLLGRFHWHKRTSESLRLAAQYFEKAIERDGGFARAYAGLADAYVLFPLYGIVDVSRADAYDRAEQAARRALALDPKLSAAHTSLAATLFFGRWRFEEAERHFEASTELDPDYAIGRYWYGELLAATGRLQEAIAEAERAVSADPSLAVAHHLLGVWRIANGDVEAGVAELRLASELEPNFPFAKVELADYYLSQGDAEAAIDYWSQSGVPPELTRLVIAASTMDALRDSARSSLDRFLASPEAPGHLGQLGAASFYALMGENDEAIRCLEKACEDRSEAVVFLPTMVRTDPGIAKLSKDERFNELLEHIGF